MKTIAELFDLSGKAAVVTGGAMGIGQAISFRLAEAGASVMIADLDMEAAEKTAEEIKAKGGKAQAIR
ncbi:MAG: SDR family NAD(P)-dependent oxidoreductase, partial [Chloroflexi bacterium]|nr:SDR family NAD(P)-dependent oxidoreductase [Chloroflexota bacterium]